ncbi:MAG: TMEM175 family protein [bacterium]
MATSSRPAAVRNTRRLWKRSDDFGFGRLGALTDAIFAVAITLVAVQVTIEKPADDSARALFDSIGAERGAWIGFIVAFVVLAHYWVANHSLFARLKAIDTRVIVLQMIYLFLIVLLPFSTRIVGDYGENPGAVVVLAVILALLCVMETVLFGYAARSNLLDYSPDATEFRWAMIASLMPVVAFLGPIPLAWVDTSLALISWIPLSLALDALAKRLAPDGALDWSRDMT